MPTLERASDIIHHHITVPVQISKRHFQEHVVRSSTDVDNSSYILQKSFIFSKTRQMSSAAIVFDSNFNGQCRNDILSVTFIRRNDILSVTFIRRNDILSQLHSSVATIFSVTFIRRNDILSQLHSSVATIFSVSYIHPSQ
jgi:hypothetical protein